MRLFISLTITLFIISMMGCAQPVIIEKQVIKPMAKEPLILKEITVTGFGPTKDAALSDAFYNAVFNAIGVYVSSEITVLNGKPIRERVTSGVRGNSKI